MIKKGLLSLSVLLIVTAAPPPVAAQEKTQDQAQKMFVFKAPLDPLIDLPSAWEITPDKLDSLFADKRLDQNPYFKWLDQKRSRAIFQRRPFSNVTIDLSFFDEKVPLEEVVVDFDNGTLLGLTVSICNRGDGGQIDPNDFNERFRACGKEIGARLGVRPKEREASATQGLESEGWTWKSAAGIAVLEHNPEAPVKIEFLRMRIARPDARGAYAAAMETRNNVMVRDADLLARVRKDDKGNVFVDGVPMVDQGQKGYCVVAAVQRIFEYYGIPCDQHQLAQIAGADPRLGTNPLVVNETLGKIDYRFNTRFEVLAIASQKGLVQLEKGKYIGNPVDERDFEKLIRRYIEYGIPLLWSLTLGVYPEEPAIALQAGGGHMRMIIGYNEKEKKIIFSDTWGAGHEFKTMDEHDAYEATEGLYLLKPTVH